MISVKVVGKTIPIIDGVKTLTEFIAYQARVSNPENQINNETSSKLIKYLQNNNHWSPFEMANIALEIKAPRDISRQILRHSSAKFQEFSQRYAEVQEFTVRELRRQDQKDRQNSIDDFSEGEKFSFEQDCKYVISICNEIYQSWLKKGAAKECARVFLPEGLTMSCLYMNAPIRTWIHYLDIREGNGTQLEHIQVANKIREELHKLEPELF